MLRQTINILKDATSQNDNTKSGSNFQHTLKQQLEKCTKTQNAQNQPQNDSQINLLDEIHSDEQETHNEHQDNDITTPYTNTQENLPNYEDPEHIKHIMERNKKS